MPSRVSAHRLRWASETSAPQAAWSNPPSRYGDEGVLAGVSPGAVAAVVTQGDGLGQGHVEAAGPGDARWPPGPPRGRGSAGCAGGRRGRRRPGSCRPAGGRRGRGGCGPGPARSRSARGRAPRARPRSPAPAARVAPGASPSASIASRAWRSEPRVGAVPSAAGVAVGVGEGDAGGPAVAGHGRGPAAVPLVLALASGSADPASPSAGLSHPSSTGPVCTMAVTRL